MATINNVEYGWTQIRIASTQLGISEQDSILSGVTAISWNKKRLTERLRGMGGPNFVARGFAGYEMDAEITFRTSTQIALRGSLDTLLELGQFDLIVSFESEFESEDVVIGNNTVTLKGCLFNEDGVDFKLDDMEAEKSFDLNVMNIVYNNNQN